MGVIAAMVIGGSTAKVSERSPPTLSHAIAATWLLNGVLVRISTWAAFIADSSQRLNYRSNFPPIIAMPGREQARASMAQGSGENQAARQIGRLQ
jgi:hypothetical protein